MAMDPPKVQNKSWPWQHYFCSFLLILSKVMLPGPAFILDLVNPLQLNGSPISLD